MDTTSIANDQRIRLPLERVLAEQLTRHAAFLSARPERLLPGPEAIRRQLLGRAVRLTEMMAPLAVQAAHKIRDSFGLAQPVELYQSAGRENAAMHLLREPILMEIQGRLLSLLDEGALHAVIGHELGHFIAHGPDSPFARESALATLLVMTDGTPEDLAALASSLSMARELTADRYGLLAAGDLDAMLRLEMVATTGLPADALGNDTQGYLAQCRELVESCLSRGEAAQGVTHPEHGVRAWAAWLFSESDLYRELTGAGAGTRSIAEVDALIAKVLARRGMDGSFQYLEAPPVELYELALSAAVLVAFADGVISDEETEIIERTFAALVPGWRELLEPAAATKRFEELAPVAQRLGPSIQRPLFSLLLHVLAADGVADTRELARVREIGTLLGCAELFDDLLRPVLLRLEVERREAGAAQPLPVRPQDAALALDAYFAAIVRRGGSQTSMRRLLRLLGVATREPDALKRVNEALARAGLRADADLAAIDLDESFALIPLQPMAEAAPASRPPPDALKRAIARLRDELVSGDGNSPSVRLRDIRGGRSFDMAALSKVSLGHAERCLALIQAGRRTVLLHGEQIGQSKDAQTQFRQLTDLRREHAARREETGARDLYLASGFVCGVVEGYVVRAPLLLHPVELFPEGESGVAVAPAADELPIANQAVFRLIHNKAGIPFANDLVEHLDAMAEDPAQGIPALIEHLRSAGIDVFGDDAVLHPLDPLPDSVYEWKGRRLAREGCVVLGLFPQSSSDLLEDYSQLLAELDSGASDPDALLGCAHALLPSGARGDVEGNDSGSAAPTGAMSLVVPADPSQVEAIRLSRVAQALVVDGPPGTGKSQVIVNLVADALARGERVAVISEKRAALDVVANRLASAGFGDLVGVVHDVQEDRKPLFAKISQRLEALLEDAPAVPAASVDIETPALAMRQRIEHLRRGAEGEPRLGELAAYAAGLQTTVPAGMPDLGELPVAKAQALARAADACRPWADLLAQDSPWRPVEPANRRSLAGTTAEQRATMAQQLVASVVTARAVEACAVTQGITPAQAAAAAEAVMVANKALVQIKQDDAVSRVLFNAQHDSGAALVALRATWMSESTLWQANPAPVRMGATASDEADVVSLLAKGDSFLRFFSPAWWSARGRVKRRLASLWPDALGRPVDIALLKELHQRLRLAKLWASYDEKANTADIRSAFAGDARQVFAALERAASIAEPVHQLRQARPALEAIDAWQPEDIARWRKQVADRFVAVAAWRKHEASIAHVREFIRVDADTSAQVLQFLQSRFETQAARAAELDARLVDAEKLCSGGALAIAACADADASTRWQDVVMKAWALASVNRQSSSLPAELANGEVDDIASQQLGEGLEAVALATRQTVRERVDGFPLLRVPSPDKHARRTPEQAAREKLQREVARQRKLLPLRSFVREYATQGLFDVLPVWLMSPETMAVLFPRAPVFDLAVFDEASQCTVANGFPALLRARRAVIAGDDRQMPPTSFFRAARDDGDMDEDDSSRPTDFLDSESLLTLARQRMPARRLSWHYRCREEELIAFSNHAMYAGSLLTCPSSAQPPIPPALRWVAVEGARYEDGRNDVEAERVVDLLHELLGRAPAPTVGIVTLNLTQRRAVLDAIDKRRVSDPQFAERIGKAETRELLDDRPFVKNIESVQGDERDVIVFSLGHAPVERVHKTRGVQRYVPARFGPVGQRGGERRLNVAVSRARQESIVVASFTPDQLSVARAKNDGPRLFKAFLEYVHHLSAGARSQAASVLDRVRSEGDIVMTRGHKEPLPGCVPLAGQLADALIARGHAVAVGVGASLFKVDVALEGERNGTPYRVAVLCDDGASDDGAFRRAQRAALLRRRGWRVVHVDSLQWLREPESVLARVVR